MIEILKIIETREKYDRYKSLIKDHILSKELSTIFKNIKGYYEDTENDSINWTEFNGYFLINNDHLDTKTIDTYTRLIDNISSLVISDDNPIINNLIIKDYALRIADVSNKILDNKTKDSTELVKLIEEMDDTTNKTKESIEDKIVTSDIGILMSKVWSEEGLHWRLKCLNESIGPLRAGNFVVLGALSEVGKTTFLISEATHMAQQTSKFTLYFNNEQAGEDIKLRMLQATLKWQQKDIELRPIDAYSKYMMIVEDKIKVIDSVFYKSEVETICKKYEPGLILIDQLWNFHTSGSEEYGKIANLFKWARELAKRYKCPVIAAHQADGSAIGQPWIDQFNLYFSRVAVQGTAELIITIAQGDDEFVRNINIPKNKLPGGPTTDPTRRHSKNYARINPGIARYEDYP